MHNSRLRYPQIHDEPKRLPFSNRAISFIFVGLSVNMFAAQGYAETNPLGAMDLEALMKMNVTTVTKRKQNLKESAAAVYIISNEDIRRSGATTLPEVLSLAPGVDVSKANSFMWAISTRGLKYLLANKLLVLIDGRSVYNPFFAGVFWESVLPSLNEIEKIEIIRGPGAKVSYLVTPQLTLAMVGKQLGDPQRLEYVDGTFNPTPSEVQRGIFFQVDWLGLP